MVNDRAFPTMIVGRSALWRDGVALMLSDTAFKVIDRAADTAQLSFADNRHADEAVSLLLHARDDTAWALGQMESLKGPHATSSVVVMVDAIRRNDLASLFKAGVNACLAEDVMLKVFLKYLELVAVGETLLPSCLLNWLPVREHINVENPQAASKGSVALSPQESHILQGLTGGLSNKMIGRQFGIAESTVKVHVKNILRRIGVTNRTQAAIWASSTTS